MNAQSHHSADYKIATRLFHFISVWIKQLCSTFVLNLTASVWCSEAYSHLFVCACAFTRPRRPNHLYHHPLQTKKPLKQLRKPPQPPAKKRQKKKEYNSTWITGFSWHRHGDEANTGKSGVTFILQALLCQGGDWSGEQTTRNKQTELKKVSNSKEAMKNSSGYIKCHSCE